LRVVENRVLRRIFGPKRDEVTGKWRKLYDAELNDLYSLSNIVRVIKSRRMRRAGHVARTGERRGIYRALVGSLKIRAHLGDPGVDGSIILRKMNLQELGCEGRDWIELAQVRDRWRALVLR